MEVRDREEALLAAIRHSPHDDAPRLVYADWLIENGDAARGELIIAQCSGNEARANELLEEHATRWLDELGVAHGRFHRGIVDDVVVSGALDAETNVRLSRLPLKRVQLCVDHPATLDAARAWTFLEHIEALSVRGSDIIKTTYGERSPLELLPLCPRVTRLDLTASRFGGERGHRELQDDRIATLAARPWRTLVLARNAIYDDCVEAIAASSAQTGLEELDLSRGYGRLTERSLCALARAPHLGSLRRLAVSTDPCRPGDRQALLERFPTAVIDEQSDDDVPE